MSEFGTDAGAESTKRRLSSGMLGVFGVLALLGLASANPLLTCCGLLMPPFLFWLLWRPGEPPILAFAAAFQWLQAFSPVLAADFQSRHISDQPYGHFQFQAAWLSLLAVLTLALGMAASMRTAGKPDLEEVRDLSNRLSVNLDKSL